VSKIYERTGASSMIGIPARRRHSEPAALACVVVTERRTSVSSRVGSDTGAWSVSVSKRHPSLQDLQLSLCVCVTL